MKKGQVVQDIMIPPIQKLRQRGVSQLTSEDSMFGDDKEDGKFSKTLKRYDAYAKIDKDVVVSSGSGGITFSILTWILVIILSLNEFVSYGAKRNVATEHLTVDTSLDQRLEIDMNITFWALNCLDVHLCAMDAAGENHLFLDNEMSKQRLSSKGSTLGKPFKASANRRTVHDVETNGTYCGSCYEAERRLDKPGENGTKKCCNTCNELIDAYVEAGLDSTAITVQAEQCQMEDFFRNLYAGDAKEESEGCNLSGTMLVNKVSGNLHVAMGESSIKQDQHIHIFDYRNSHNFNISHTIHKLSFGASYPGKPRDALDGMVQYLDENTGTGFMQYFINIVPTTYDGSVSGSSSDMITSSQYSYTMKFRSIYGTTMLPNSDAHEWTDENEKEKHRNRQTKADVMPSVFFVYEITPYVLSVTYGNKEPFTHLIIRLCAISGGVVTISRLLETVFHAFVAYIAKRTTFLPS